MIETRHPAPHGTRHHLRRCAARLLLLAPLAAASAQATTNWAVSYFTLPGMQVSYLVDIDNQGRLLAWGSPDAETAVTGGFLVAQGTTQALTAPNGQPAFGRSFSETGLIVGGHSDPSRTHSSIALVWDPITQTQVPTVFTTPMQVGFVAGPGNVWQMIDAPAPGLVATNITAVSPNGRYLTGTYNTESTPIGQFVQDRQSGTTSLIPASANLFLAYAVDNAGTLYASSSNTRPRQAVLFNPVTAQRSVLPNLGFQSLLARAVNANGLMAGSLTTQAGEGRAWVGSASGITVLDTKPGFTSAAGINDLGQVVGSWTSDDGLRVEGFIATPVVLPEAGSPPGTFSFSVDVRADTPVFIDPLVAVGYTYAIGAGDPLFKTVSLPVGIGDGRYTLHVGNLSLDIGGNQIVDFTALGFAQGVAGFTVTGIETGAALDPNDSSAFVTRLTFMADGRFTGTQTAISVDVPAVPEPATAVLWLLGVGGLLAWGQQNRRHVQQQPLGAEAGRT